MAKKSKRGGFINPSAKKYSELRKKQAQANRYLRESKASLKEENNGQMDRSLNSALNRLHMFQKKHGQSRKNTFSMESLRTGDVDMYEQLLDSINTNTWLNKEKRAKHKENQIDFAIQQGWAEDEEQAETVYRVANSELVAELKELSLSDVPSDILDKFAEYVDSGFTEDDFYKMITDFQSDVNNGEVDVNEFFSYSDEWLEMHTK